jgi:hypothetical protein
MRRYYAPVVLVAALAFAAPAQADVTASVITTPKSPHYALSKGPGTTIDVAGRATGAGNVKIVCDHWPAPSLLAGDVPVAGDGTFAVHGLSIDRLVADGSGATCRLRALPAGNLFPDPAPFRGPVLAVSAYTPNLVTDGGANNGKLGSFLVYASGVDHATVINNSFGGNCGLINVPLDPGTFAAAYANGLFCAGGPTNDPITPMSGLQVDGAFVQTAGALWSPAANGLQEKAGFPELTVPAVDFDASTGAVAVTERNRLAKCGPDGTFPVFGTSCTEYTPVPVAHERTTTVLPGDQIIRVVDRWSSLDAQPHRLMVALETGPAVFQDARFRFPGQASYAERQEGDIVRTLPAGAPVFGRYVDATQPGVAVVPLQSPDAARFHRGGNFDLLYGNRTIPARGQITFTHYYVTTSRGDQIEAATAKLLASLAPAAPLPPRGGGTGPAVAPLPRFSRAGHLRVRHSGRTFRVTTRDRVTCPTACTVHIAGRRVVATDLHVAAGARAAVRFRLTRAGARKLRRAGRLRLHVALTAGTVTTQRTLTVREPA